MNIKTEYIEIDEWKPPELPNVYLNTEKTIPILEKNNNKM